MTAALLSAQDLKAGKRSVDYAPRKLASGVYIYRISAEAEGRIFTEVRKMTLMK